MLIDVKALLDLVATEVFDSRFSVEKAGSNDPTAPYAIQVSSHFDIERSVRIRVSYEWMDIDILDFGVGAILFNDDLDETKAIDIRRICRVAHSYLSGKAHIETRRRFWKGSTTTVMIDEDRMQWQLGRHSCHVPYP
ncbi:hypothetical protein AUR04nite_22470 [Glutamicibacter uratoxydans]|uniref:Uncharacterized protein n=1 Tax=Glutamicibacter uratoxydans TaxID=43667 RepID=A0A4Y4DSY7_GLUUR|nr:hypothetical protein [Glutamicibacter uratoxydans]GED06715.1 hypothetical protein AUR04nite_22470 [Glutamicibacter uratoxydans]